MALREIRPLLSGTRVYGDFYDAGTSPNWFLRTFSICSTPLPGLELVSATSATSSSDFRSATVTCPAGKRVVGTGARVTGGLNAVVLDDIRPDSPLETVNAQAHEDQAGTTGDWAVIAYAVCAEPPPGLELVTTSSAVASQDANLRPSAPSAST